LAVRKIEEEASMEEGAVRVWGRPRVRNKIDFSCVPEPRWLTGGCQRGGTIYLLWPTRVQGATGKKGDVADR